MLFKSIKSFYYGGNVALRSPILIFFITGELQIWYDHLGTVYVSDKWKGGDLPDTLPFSSDT